MPKIVFSFVAQAGTYFRTARNAMESHCVSRFFGNIPNVDASVVFIVCVLVLDVWHGVRFVFFWQQSLKSLFFNKLKKREGACVVFKLQCGIVAEKGFFIQRFSEC